MPIKLNGQTSGSVQLDVPAAVSGGDVTLTLPNGTGSANQYLANGSTAGELTFVTPPGSFTSYAIICDKKAYNENGGTFTSGAYRTRALQTEITDVDNIVSIANDQFTLPNAGNYLIKWSCPARQVSRHHTQLYNITDSQTVEFGTTEVNSNASSIETRSFGSARVSITGSTVFEIQHRGQYTKTTSGFGINTDISGADSIYTIVEIFKEA